MAKNFEIKDTQNPTWKGQRFGSEATALRELAHAVGAPGRFALVNRTTRETIAISS